MKMQSTDLFSTLKRFDAYPKTLEDFRVKTLGGGAGVCNKSTAQNGCTVSSNLYFF